MPISLKTLYRLYDSDSNLSRSYNILKSPLCLILIFIKMHFTVNSAANGSLNTRNSKLCFDNLKN